MLKFLSIAFTQKSDPSDQNFITIVSGLPRSGTSMMMNMLEEGGMEIITDNIRIADDDNPKGYYEFERVKKLKDGDVEWLKDAHGKSVKIISALLENLPDLYSYKIIFMCRNMDEILASQKQMLVRRGEPTDKVNDRTLAELFEKHIEHIEAWLKMQENIKTIFVDYNQLIFDPQRLTTKIIQFLEETLNQQKMVDIVDRKLYRQRH
ncbi:sulfotransferase domain-containing protein [Chloroflexota bacterium]